MKVIITGGAGFIGGHAVRHFLGKGDDIVNIDKITYAGRDSNLNICRFERFDICDTARLSSLVKEFDPDVFLHFAAETHVDNSIEDCRSFVHSNVAGVSSVLDACRKNGVRLCHISTDEVYGPASDRPFEETDALNPKNPYSATKAAGDMLVSAFNNTYGMDYLIVRPSNNYGPGQHREKFIPKFLECLKNGGKFPLYGDGGQEREWTYVKDTVAHIRDLILHEKTDWNSVYNLSSGYSSTNVETAKKIVGAYNQLNGKSINVEEVLQRSADRPGHDRKYWIASNKLHKLLKPSYTDFETGIRETVSEKYP